MKKSLFALCTCALLFAACQQEVPPVPAEVVVEKTEYQIPIEGTEDLVVTFSSNKSWTAALSETVKWLIISPSSGDAGENCEIHVIAIATEEFDGRSVNLVITAEDASATITFTQGQVDNCELVTTSQDFDEKGGEAVVTVKTNIDWSVTVPEDAASWVHAVETKAYGEQSLKFKVDAYDEIGGTRTAVLKVEAGKSSADFTIKQTGAEALFEIVYNESDLEVAKEGDSFEVKFDTNCEYEVEVEGTGLSFVHEGDTYTFTMAKAAWSSREAYIYVTVPTIQLPVLDDEGNPTGETEDYWDYLVVSQEGYAEVSYVSDITSYIDSTTVSVATTGEYVLVASGKSVHAYNKATGEHLTPVEAGVYSIANDDAGNIVAVVGDTDDFMIMAAPAASAADPNTYVVLNTCHNDIYGYGLDNMTVRGDILNGDAVVTFCSAGAPTYGGATVLAFFDYSGGKFLGDGETYSDYVTCTQITADVWNSKTICAINVGAKSDSGVYYSGYDGQYSLWYNPTTSAVNWVETIKGFGSWASAITAMDIVTLAGKDYLIALEMTLFPYPAVSWGSPSVIHIIDITTPTEPVLVDSISYYTENAMADYRTNAIQAEVVDNTIELYIADFNYNSLIKVKLPAID